MNEYTYKAKKLEDGEWTSGSLFAGVNHHIIMQGINLKDMVVNGNEVDKETICRYAWNDFWEHDIIMHGNDLGVIRYGEYAWKVGWHILWFRGEREGISEAVAEWFNKDDVFVVGNEIDTPIDGIIKRLEECLNEEE